MMRVPVAPRLEFINLYENPELAGETVVGTLDLAARYHFETIFTIGPFDVTETSSVIMDPNNNPHIAVPGNIDPHNNPHSE